MDEVNSWKRRRRSREEHVGIRGEGSRRSFYYSIST
jgi:hypothetical protein